MMELEQHREVNTMTQKDGTKKPATPRKGRPSAISKNRATFGLRIDVALLDDLRSMADDVGLSSLNAYIVMVLMQHAKFTKAGE